MKRLFIAMFTLGIAGFASAQSYDHGQPQNGNQNSYGIAANDHGNNGRQNVVVINGGGSHSSGYGYQQQTHGYNYPQQTHGYAQPVYERGHEPRQVVVVNGHERQEETHMRREERRWNNGHRY